MSLAELQCPLADRLVGDDDATAGHQFLDVAKAQRKPEVEPHHVADELGRKAEAAVNLEIFHPATLQNFAGCRKLTVPDAKNANQDESLKMWEQVCRRQQTLLLKNDLRPCQVTYEK